MVKIKARNIKFLADVEHRNAEVYTWCQFRAHTTAQMPEFVKQHFGSDVPYMVQRYRAVIDMALRYDRLLMGDADAE